MPCRTAERGDVAVLCCALREEACPGGSSTPAAFCAAPLWNRRGPSSVVAAAFGEAPLVNWQRLSGLVAAGARTGPVCMPCPGAEKAAPDAYSGRGPAALC